MDMDLFSPLAAGNKVTMNTGVQLSELLFSILGSVCLVEELQDHIISYLAFKGILKVSQWLHYFRFY